MRKLLPIALLSLATLTGTHPAPAHTQPPQPQAQPQQTPPLDLNTATPAQLRALPGMGQVYVDRILAGRPYTAKNQLVTRGVLPAAAYQLIKDRIVAHRATAHIHSSASSQTP